MHALMVVDLQKEFNVPAAVVDRIRARAEQFPVRVFTRFCNPPGTLFRRKLDRKMCAPGTPGTELVLDPKNNDLVLEKSTYGLTAEHINKLRSAAITEVTVAGVDTDACVLGVLFSLWDHGINCRLAPDICWSSSGLHEAAVKIAEEQFGS